MRWSSILTLTAGEGGERVRRSSNINRNGNAFTQVAKNALKKCLKLDFGSQQVSFLLPHYISIYLLAQCTQVGLIFHEALHQKHTHTHATASRSLPQEH